jgi:hypothetical protein
MYRADSVCFIFIVNILHFNKLGILMTKVCKPRTRHDPYDPNVTRVVSIRVLPETLKHLRLIAAEADLTVCSMLRIQAEKLVSDTAN